MTLTTKTIDVPLTPHVLHGAGVSINDALWIQRLSANAAKSQVIQKTSRGKDVVFRVRNFMHQATMSGSASMHPT